MRCSHVARSLLMGVLGVGLLALGTSRSGVGVAADFTPEPALCTYDDQESVDPSAEEYGPAGPDAACWDECYEWDTTCEDCTPDATADWEQASDEWDDGCYYAYDDEYCGCGEYAETDAEAYGDSPSEQETAEVDPCTQYPDESECLNDGSYVWEEDYCDYEEECAEEEFGYEYADVEGYHYGEEVDQWEDDSVEDEYAYDYDEYESEYGSDYQDAYDDAYDSYEYADGEDYSYDYEAYPYEDECGQYATDYADDEPAWSAADSDDIDEYYGEEYYTDEYYADEYYDDGSEFAEETEGSDEAFEDEYYGEEYYTDEYYDDESEFAEETEGSDEALEDEYYESEYCHGEYSDGECFTEQDYTDEYYGDEYYGDGWEQDSYGETAAQGDALTDDCSADDARDFPPVPLADAEEEASAEDEWGYEYEYGYMEAGEPYGYSMEAVDEAEDARELPPLPCDDAEEEASMEEDACDFPPLPMADAEEEVSAEDEWAYDYGYEYVYPEEHYGYGQEDTESEWDASASEYEYDDYDDGMDDAYRGEPDYYDEYGYEVDDSWQDEEEAWDDDSQVSTTTETPDAYEYEEYGYEYEEYGYDMYDSEEDDYQSYDEEYQSYQGAYDSYEGEYEPYEDEYEYYESQQDVYEAAPEEPYSYEDEAYYEDEYAAYDSEYETSGYDEDGYDDYGESYYGWSELGDSSASQTTSLELGDWRPSELLERGDREVIRQLHTLGEEPAGVRRAALNEHLESLGPQAIDFAGQLEETAGIDVLGMCDDLGGVAALLGAFRLVEREEIDMDEAVDLIDRGLGELPTEWVEQVGEITVEEPDVMSGASVERGLIEVMASWADESFGEISSKVRELTADLSAARLMLLGVASTENAAVGASDWSAGQL